jgi:hypothetical protein
VEGRGREADEGVAFLFKTNSVEWIKGTGTFKDTNTIGVEGSEDLSFKSAAHADPTARVGRRHAEHVRDVVDAELAGRN